MDSTFSIRNPATGNLLRECEEDSPQQIQQKFMAACRALAQNNNNEGLLKERLGVIRNFRKLLKQKTEYLAEILTQEMGKPISQSRTEIRSLRQRIDFFLKYTQEELQPRIMRTENSLEEFVSYEPLGVIANISAWNYPYFVGGNVFIPALLCGNSVLYKPSEYTTLTGLEIARLFAEASLDPDAFQVVLGRQSAAETLLDQKIDGIFFTGSYATGKKVAERTSKKMIPMQLELGGKDPAYVHADVDVSQTAQALAYGVFYNNGQSCCAVERIYTHQKIHTQFVSEFLNTVKSFRRGDPLDAETFLGPLSRPEQLNHLEAQVEDALEKGGELCLGGKRMNKAGYYFEPTVFVRVNHQMKLMREESFGPIIGIQKVKDEAEGLALMQDTEYGLTAAVYAKNRGIAETMLKQMDAGSVYWNTCDRVSPYLPWSGRKHSGLGSTLSLEGIRAFLKPKAWHCIGE